MEERDNILTEAKDSREIVLRYDAPTPEPVVERYVHPDPLPGRHPLPGRQPLPGRHPLPEQQPLPEQGGTNGGARVPKRKPRARRGAWVLLLCAALLLAAKAGDALFGWAFDRLMDRGGSYSDEYTFRAENPSGSEGSTTIPRISGDANVRLRFSETRGEALTIQQVYERVNPCTVTVAAMFTGTSAAVGTGVIFSEDGYILTNAHVIQGGSEAIVVLADGTLYHNARLVGWDETNDLAVLKIEASGLRVAEFGDSDALTVGDTVYAIGNPLGIELRGTLTDGIVSAINRDVETGDGTMTLIQTNAALNNGNSGGPLINVYGQVVGVNTMKMGSRMGSRATVSVEGLGFAIPISSAAWMVDDLVAYGELRGEPVLGITVEAGELASGERAVLVREVARGSACDASGVRVGDAVVRAEGEALETTGDLLRVRRRFRAGETMTLTIERDGERFDVAVTLRAAE